MKTVKLIIFLLVLVITAPLAVWWRARVRTVEYQKILQQQAAQFAQLLAENNRLSNNYATATLGQLSRDDFKELLQLRGEMHELRQKAEEAARLRLAANPESGPRTNRISEQPGWDIEQTIQAHWTKEQLQFAGRATPVNALQSSLWVFAQNNPDILASYIDPESRSNLIAGAFMEGGTAEERLAWQAKSMAQSLAPSSGFYAGAEISSRIPDLNPDLHIFPVYFEDEALTRLFALRNIDGEWKLQGIYRPVQVEGAVHLGRTLWP
jgi:hypothetical protein